MTETPLAAQPTQHLSKLLSGLSKSLGPLVLFYAAVSLVGVIYNRLLFREFGINILHYYQTSDFLLSGLRQIGLLLSVFAALVVLLAATIFWLKPKTAARTWQAATLCLLLVVVFSVGAVAYRAESDAARLKRCEPIVSVRFGDNNDQRRVTMLGNSADYLVIYEKSANRVHILPRDLLQHIEFDPRDSDKPTDSRDRCSV